MGLKLRGSTGKYACSSCYMAVEASATFCESCGTIFDGEMRAKSCPSCETLMNTNTTICPICNVKLEEAIKEKAEKADLPGLDGEDKAFLTKMLAWAQVSGPFAKETVEDKKEREHAMEVLSSIAAPEPEPGPYEGIRKEIEGTREDQEEFKKYREELQKMGKPFESILERNIMNMDLLDKEFEEKKAEYMRLERETGKEAKERQKNLKKELEELRIKKETLVSYEQNILMIGGAYRKLLKEQQERLLRIEEDLEKRVDAFRREVDRRERQKERLRRREETLDRREEELSNRFLDYKRRENELKILEDNLKKGFDELRSKEEVLSRSKPEILANPNGGVNAKLEKSRQEMKKMGDLLQTREKEIDQFKKDLNDLNALITEKQGEIEKLSGKIPDSIIDRETKKILKILDELLEKLPEEVVDRFARSDDYLLYEKILDKYKI